MTTFTMPSTPNFASASFGLVANTQIFTGPLDGSIQTLELVGARFAATYSLPIMVRSVAAPWTAFLTKLLGSSGRFFAFDPVAKTPLGSGVGDSPLVDGASQTGKSLSTKAWSATQTGLLIAGDYFTVNGELKLVTASVDSDGAGLATVNFVPSLRASPVNNAALTLSNPTCTMRLVQNDAALWDLTTAQHYGITFEGIEAFV